MDITHLPVILHAIAASWGVLSHLIYFIRGEHHKQAILFCQLAVLLPTTICVLLVHFTSWTFGQGVWLTGSITATYFGALWSSMISYRSFFHRLHHFPGPRLAKVSKLFQFFSNLKLDSYRRLEHWHHKYGNVVRIGKWTCRLSCFVFVFLGKVRLVF